LYQRRDVSAALLAEQDSARHQRNTGENRYLDFLHLDVAGEILTQLVFNALLQEWRKDEGQNNQAADHGDTSNPDTEKHDRVSSVGNHVSLLSLLALKSGDCHLSLPPLPTPPPQFLKMIFALFGPPPFIAAIRIAGQAFDRSLPRFDL
jgi:hypothetical protein